MKHTNILFNNNAYYKKARQWSQTRIFLLIIAVSVGLLCVEWRSCCLEARSKHYQSLTKQYNISSNAIRSKQTIESTYATLQQQCKELNRWREYCFMLECLERLAPILADDIRFETLISNQADHLLIAAQAQAAEQVFVFMEVLDSQDWLESATLESLHKSAHEDVQRVVFSVRLIKKSYKTMEHTKLY